MVDPLPEGTARPPARRWPLWAAVVTLIVGTVFGLQSVNAFGSPITAALAPVQVQCEPGTVSPDGLSFDLHCLLPPPVTVTVTETTVVPTTITQVVPTTVTQTVTQTVTASPSPSPSVSPTTSASPTPSTTPTPTATPGGGCPAYPAMPNAACTGYAHTGVTLHSCALRITAPGTYDSCRFAGTVVIASTGVTISRSLIQGGHVEGSSGADLRSALLQDVTIIGAGNDGSAAIGNNNYTCRRCDISGGLRGFAIGSNVVIEDSYAHNFWVQPSSWKGANSVHQTAASTHGGAHIRITHSTLICGSDSYACSSGVSLYSEDSPGISDVLIEQSYLATDAGFGIMFASLVSGKPYGITNTRVLNCIFGPSEYGPVANFPSSQAGNVWSGNKRENGTTVPAA